ncbi:KIF16B [Symbiodinium pilosum]|uniref:KIF16B protein n=1 Tax=Symbiodinium pilosum TaxID=2952 RepID=A0A812KRV9_SYMPI|nr:KIF16B [Symbiodinium pilosum]
MAAFLMLLVTLRLAFADLSAGKFNNTLQGAGPRHLAACGLAGKVDCGVCECTVESACQWCDGNGGPARVGSISRPSGASLPVSAVSNGKNGECPSNMVNCGVCKCTTSRACQYCDGMGGPAKITGSGTISAVPRGSTLAVTLLALPLTIALWQ